MDRPATAQRLLAGCGSEYLVIASVLRVAALSEGRRVIRGRSTAFWKKSRYRRTAQTSENLHAIGLFAASVVKMCPADRTKLRNIRQTLLKI